MSETPKSFEELRGLDKACGDRASLTPKTAPGSDEWTELERRAIDAKKTDRIVVFSTSDCVLRLIAAARQAASPDVTQAPNSYAEALEQTFKPAASPAAQTEVGEGEHQAKKLYRGRASYDFIKNGEFQTDGFAVAVAGHKIAECEDSEVSDWICKQWNVPEPPALTGEGDLPEKWLYQDLEYYAPEVIEPWARTLKRQLRDAIAQRDEEGARHTKWVAKQAVHLFEIGLRTTDTLGVWRNARAEAAEAKLAESKPEPGELERLKCMNCGDPIEKTIEAGRLRQNLARASKEISSWPPWKQAASDGPEHDPPSRSLPSEPQVLNSEEGGK